MKFVSTVLWVLALATTAACQARSIPPTVPQGSTAQADAPETLPQSSTAQDVTMIPSQEETGMTPVSPPNEAAEKLVALVKQHLAQRLNLSIDQILLSDIKPVVWRDAGLGCPKPGIDYIQVETPGYNILLEAGGMTYRYHTDETRRFVPCNR